ncbi:hypothetical protein PYW07_006492 [Mythimna separata]|uniref:Uncharacterized protein n=1 Tax=Mythimna separata TaxID=271217 RepID=A0AAD8DXJ0_MYTSE|nr:hypothetical protein PYW07_006492 [Mythimna separata]
MVIEQSLMKSMKTEGGVSRGRSTQESVLSCGQCNGHACLNAAQYPSNPDEENAYDPEILEGLEMNMTDNEDDDNELNVFERQQEEDDEEDEDN